MIDRCRRTILLAALPLAALTGAAMLSAQSSGDQAPDRSVEVNGWTIEDSAAPSDFDSQARTISMRRGDDFSGLMFNVELSGDNLDGWGQNMFEARGAHEGQSCWRSGPVMAETGPPEERAQRVRAVLAREIGRLERECRSPAGAMVGQLEGFEGAFALLSAWYGERQAQVRASVEAEAYQAYGNNVSVGYDDAMPNAADSVANLLDDYPPE